MSAVSSPHGPILLTCDNVLLGPDKLANTPSRQDGMEEEMEWETRVVGCELISSAGILLKLPQTAMATGQVLFHRFFYAKSFLRLDMERTAMACVYLASKIEERPRSVRDVINVFHHLHQLRSRSEKEIEPMVLDQAYINLKADVILAERRVLKELGFCVHVKHPHKLIVVYLQQLGCNDNSEFVQMSWNYMSDSLRTSVWVQFRIEAIACACIFLSARKLGIPLPDNPAWYLVYDVEEEQILDICESILVLYERSKVNYDEFTKKYKALRQEYKAAHSTAEHHHSASATVSSSEASSIASSASHHHRHHLTEALEGIAIKEKEKEAEDQNSTNQNNNNVGEVGEEVGERKKPESMSLAEKAKRSRSPSPISRDRSKYYHSSSSKRRRSRSRSSSHSGEERTASSKKDKDYSRPRRHRSDSKSRRRHSKSKKRSSHFKYRRHNRSRSRSNSPPEKDKRYKDKEKKASRSEKEKKGARERERSRSRGREFERKQRREC